MKNKLVKIGLIILIVLIYMCNSIYAEPVRETNEETKSSFSLETTMNTVMLIMEVIIIGYTVFLIVRRKKKNNIGENKNEEIIKNNCELDKENLEEDKLDENKTRYLIATIILLLPVIFLEYVLIFSGDPIGMIMGIVVLIVLIMYNWNNGLTHLDRFYCNVKALAMLVILFIFVSIIEMGYFNRFTIIKF